MVKTKKIRIETTLAKKKNVERRKRSCMQMEKKKKEKVGTLFRFIKKINGYKEITKIIT